ncbi:MAG: hypothetical protein QOF21_3054 [Actinomycetota bacterium]|jgi:hypothetical protein
MKRTTRVTAIAVAVLVLPLAAAGCSNDSSKGDKVAFCKLNAEIDAVLDTVQSDEQAFAAFTEVLPTMDRGLKQAPKAIKPDVQTSISAIRHGLEIDDLSELNSPQLDAASEHIRQYCS